MREEMKQFRYIDEEDLELEFEVFDLRIDYSTFWWMDILGI